MGNRVGKKRSDRRWQDDDGNIWASKFEYQVYERLQDAGRLVRKCDKGYDDTFCYHSRIKSGSCSECGSKQIIQRRTYTPDLFIPTSQGLANPNTGERGIYLETKGYFNAHARKLYRDFQETGPDITLGVIAERDNWVTKGKSKLSDYFQRYLKTVKFTVWNKIDIPGEWLE